MLPEDTVQHGSGSEINELSAKKLRQDQNTLDGVDKVRFAKILFILVFLCFINFILIM